MKKLLTLLLFLAAFSPGFNAAAQDNWGIGFRLGDPSGISIKKYMAGKALELSIGRSHVFSRRGWYDDRFYDWYKDEKFGYADYKYHGSSYSVPIAFQLHYLIEKDIKGLDGLKWYVGFGAQVRYQNHYYSYYFKYHNDPYWYYTKEQRVTDFDFGPDGVIGLEYRMEDLPISFFADATLFMEIADNPFLFWGQGGIGARYNF